MEFAFPWPYSPGEWLAWTGAALTALFGLANLFVPRLGLPALAAPPERAGSRSLLGGFYAGIGLSAILFAQPLIYLTLGLAWALAAFGRVVSMLSDGGNAYANWVSLALTVALAALPLAFALGFVP